LTEVFKNVKTVPIMIAGGYLVVRFLETTDYSGQNVSILVFT
jgi:predicted permease